MATRDPSRSRSKELPAGPRTASEARRFLAEALDRFDVDVDRETATLLTSEIAMNAARHGMEPISVTVSIEDDDLRVSVLDHGSGFDPEDLGTRPQGGWGLRFVRDLSTDWGVDRRQDGTEVWFRL